MCNLKFYIILVWRKFSQNKNLATIIYSDYNPMLNPIESAWSCLNAAVKRNLSVQLPQILASEDKVNIPLHEYRLRHLENLINQNMKSINVNNCARYVGNVQRYIPDSLNLIDINM
ncbi:hypothetical protein C0J52_04795 [Blattella germanica]|nr:hypothetical protein C0J52_04795 [Blattella germanica]